MGSELLLLLLLFVLGTIFFISRVRDNKKKPTRGSFDAQSAKALRTQIFIHGPAFVVDGDTIVIKRTQVRLFGIDAPELNHPYGERAKRALFRLCKGQTVNARIIEQDAYGRTVAQCYLEDGRDLSAEMVKLGLAIDWPKFSGGAYSSLETADARKKLWLASARQKGHMHVWDRFEAQQEIAKRQRPAAKHGKEDSQHH
ncbi:MAG: thermonuclease family protein [Pseudorhodobacter sp.]